MQIASLLELGVPLVASQADLTPAQIVMLGTAAEALSTQREKQSKKGSNDSDADTDVKSKLKSRGLYRRNES